MTGKELARNAQVEAISLDESKIRSQDRVRVRFDTKASILAHQNPKLMLIDKGSKHNPQTHCNFTGVDIRRRHLVQGSLDELVSRVAAHGFELVCGDVMRDRHGVILTDFGATFEGYHARSARCGITIGCSNRGGTRPTRLDRRRSLRSRRRGEPGALRRRSGPRRGPCSPGHRSCGHRESRRGSA